jgi:hypothetical protein
MLHLDRPASFFFRRISSLRSRRDSKDFLKFGISSANSSQSNWAYPLRPRIKVHTAGHLITSWQG